MPVPYSVIEIFSSEEARYDNKPLHEAVVQFVAARRIGARCMVSRGVQACYENGEIATQSVLVLSFNLPIKIEILLPTSELNGVLSAVEEMVTEGLVGVRALDVSYRKLRHRLLPRHILVRDVMTRNPKSVGPSTPVGEAARLLLSSPFTGLPVVDRYNRPVGVVSQTDLIYRAGLPLRVGLLDPSQRERIDAVLAAMPPKKTEEVMSRPAVSVQEDAPVAAAVNIMLDRGVKRLPVLDPSGELVGILSRIDVFRIITKTFPEQAPSSRPAAGSLEEARLVSDIMLRETLTVTPDVSVEEVLRIIDSNDLRRVAVVDRDGRLQGLISDRDLLIAFSDLQPGLWDFLIGRLPFTEKRKRLQGGDALRQKTAAEVMKTDLIFVREDTRVDEAIRIMTEKRFKRLPVVDAEGRFTGMINREALLRAGPGRD